MRTTPCLHGIVLGTAWSDRASRREAMLRDVAEDFGVVLTVQKVARVDRLAAAYAGVRTHLGVARDVVDSPGLLAPRRLASYGVLAGGTPAAAEQCIRNTIGHTLAQCRTRCEPWVRTLELLDEAKGDIGEVAARLCLSEDGVKERLRVFGELVGMSPFEVKHSVDVFLAVRLLRVYREHLPPSVTGGGSRMTERHPWGVLSRFRESLTRFSAVLPVARTDHALVGSPGPGPAGLWGRAPERDPSVRRAEERL